MAYIRYTGCIIYRRSSIRFSPGYISQMVFYEVYVGYIVGIKNFRSCRLNRYSTCYSTRYLSKVFYRVCKGRVGGVL